MPKSKNMLPFHLRKTILKWSKSKTRYFIVKSRVSWLIQADCEPEETIAPLDPKPSFSSVDVPLTDDMHITNELLHKYNLNNLINKVNEKKRPRPTSLRLVIWTFSLYVFNTYETIKSLIQLYNRETNSKSNSLQLQADCRAGGNFREALILSPSWTEKSSKSFGSDRAQCKTLVQESTGKV